MVSPLLHIGYHKTGTSWLQRHVFSRRDLGLVRISLRDMRPWEPHPFDFDPAVFRERYGPLLEAATAGGGLPVVSSERLSGNPHSGGYDSKEIAERLAQIFPGARVLIVVREQRSMILSTWIQYVKAGGGCSLPEYIQGPQDPRLPLFCLQHFRYDRLVAHYQRLFGKDRVKVEFYERFRRVPQEYISSVLSFCGASEATEFPYEQFENRSPNDLAISVRRRLNPFLRRDSLNGYSPLCNAVTSLGARVVVLAIEHAVPRLFGRPLRRSWQRVVERSTSSFYADSNRRLAELTSTDVVSLGYVCE